MNIPNQDSYEEQAHYNKYKHTSKPRNGHSNSLLHKYNITYTEIAKAFGYSSANSFNGSKAKEDMLRGIKWIIEQVEKYNK